MKRHKAFKFRLYPTAEQATLINKTIGCSRFVFNHFLVKWNDTYKETGKGLTYGTCSAQLPEPWECQERKNKPAIWQVFLLSYCIQIFDERRIHKCH